MNMIMSQHIYSKLTSVCGIYIASHACYSYVCRFITQTIIIIIYNDDTATPLCHDIKI